MQGYDIIVPIKGWLLQKLVDPNHAPEEECKDIDIILLERLTVKQRAFYGGSEISCSSVHQKLDEADKPKCVGVTRYRESKALCSRFRLDGYCIHVAHARQFSDIQECTFDKYQPSDYEKFYTNDLVYNI